MATEDRKQIVYPKEEVVQLVRTLDRKQDDGLFSQDVLLQYPHLEEAYTKVCPKRTDLATAAQRAERGDYSYDARLALLREDIDLMVDNCRRFNGPTGPLVDAANRFGTFAHEQINAYIAKKTGGRRASTLRIVATGDAAAAAGTRGGKSNHSNNSPSTTTASSSNGRAAHEDRRRKRHREEESAAQPVTPAELAKLVDSLGHREYRRAFRADVGEMYPHLREAYEEVCPEKMNLTIVKERAASGYYTQQRTPPPQSPARTRRETQQQQQQESESGDSLFGDSVADSFVRLRRDVELMVSNCIRFNANESSWVDLARSFQRFAHNLIDEFVLRHAPALRGTRSGVDAYAAEPLPPPETQRKPQEKEKAQAQEKEKAQAQEKEKAQAQEKEQVQAKAREPAQGKRLAAARAAAEVAMASRVSLTVRPTPLQPSLAPPESLRQRIVADHLHRETLRARLIRSGDEAEAFPPELSSRAALHAFMASVREFFRAKRAREDFHDAFEYTRQEEQLYADCAALIAQQFERLFPHALLYSQEKADVFEWRAMRALRTAAQMGGAAPPTRWLDEAHLCYLVRFLVHFPQLMGLACATSVAPAEPNTKPALQVTAMAKGVIDKLARITDELLAFIARYEAKLTAQPVVQANEKEKEESEKVVNEALTSNEEKVNEASDRNETVVVNEEAVTQEL